MILSCPACSTRYSVPDTALGAAGRAVRCASCRHSWRVEVSYLDGAAFVTNAAAPAAAPTPAPPPAPKPAHAAWRARAERRRRRQSLMLGLGGWGGVTAGLALALALGWAFRADIVRALPQTASAYALAGAEVNRYGLVIETIESARVAAAGAPALSVQAQLRNTDRRSRPAPLVRFDLRDATGAGLFAWTMTPDVGTLAPGESVTVAALLANPPDAATDVVMTLTDEALPAPVMTEGGDAEGVRGPHVLPLDISPLHSPTLAAQGGA